ncbi:diacylglycerol/polyprenol kinase family protein [Roseofilum casamattae]|uniref:Dolichol kinase n=1 Tax=Roseofilum casamattae BLCC-M143 TaxID=3022442 RepID=A0ABT7BV64_9CYAN|nr:hypothetical protein [Roseofilum casamattae]MDJ1183088.1 hypothetical protein [Roseofilum casamattae BLCC-M143]
MIPPASLFPPWVGILLVLSALAGLMLGLRLYQQIYSPHPEWVRKLLHIGMGLVTLSFPWLFDSPIPVIALAIAAIAFLGGIKLISPLRDRLGSVTGGVARTSWGEIYFPISVALVFVFADGNLVCYLVPLLILTLADAVAALIGIGYGFHTYSTSEGGKSAEGSIAFFTVAFLSTHIPVLLLTDTGRAESLLMAIIIGLQVMVLEAIAWQGLDNLFIPLGGLIMVKLFLPMGIPALGFRVILTLILGTLTLSLRHRTTLNDSAVLGSAWLGYLTWVLRSWHWFIPPAILFAAYSLWCPWTQRYKQRRHDMRAVLSIGITGMFWLLLAKTGQLGDASLYFYPYTVTFAAHLALIDIAVPQIHPQLPTIDFIGQSVVKAWGLLFFPFVLMQGWSQHTLMLTGVAFLLVVAIALTFAGVQKQWRHQSKETWMWASRSAIVTIGSAIGLWVNLSLG